MIIFAYFLLIHYVLGSTHNETEYIDGDDIATPKDATVEENTKIYDNTSKRTEDLKNHKENGSENSNINTSFLTPLKVLSEAASRGFREGLELMKKTENAIHTRAKHAFDTIIDLAGRGTGSSGYHIFGTR